MIDDWIEPWVKRLANEYAEVFSLNAGDLYEFGQKVVTEERRRAFMQPHHERGVATETNLPKRQ